MADAVSLKDVAKILSAYPGERRYSLAILQDLQHKFGYVPGKPWKRFPHTWALNFPSSIPWRPFTGHLA